MIVLRNGMHIPKKEWAAWRDDCLAQLLVQGPFKLLEKDCYVVAKYWAGDLRRRDVAGMMDAICHVLERAKIVRDDSLLKTWCWFSMHDKSNPRLELSIEEI